jgi:hypothetical protein
LGILHRRSFCLNDNSLCSKATFYFDSNFSQVKLLDGQKLSAARDFRIDRRILDKELRRGDEGSDDDAETEAQVQFPPGSLALMTD